MVVIFSVKGACSWVVDGNLFTIRLDFGDGKIKAAENFLRIAQNTIYDEKNGYGWEKKYNSLYPISTKDLTSKPNQTGLTGTEQVTLIVNAENGIYKGIITPAIVGKDITRLYRYSLLSNDEVLIDKVDVPERTFTVRITDGKLKLTFKPVENGWVVHSIVLMPVEKFLQCPEEFEKARRLLIIGDDEKIENLEIPELKYRETILPSFIKQDMVLFKKSITDKIIPSYRPTKQELLNKIELTAAGDEYESYQLGILSKKPVPQLRFSISDLKGKTTIPSRNITIRTQYYFTYKNYLHPKTLDSREEIELYPNYAQGLWLTAYIPLDTPEGIYKGTITFYGLNLKEKKIPVEIKVLPFNLPRLKNHFYNIMWLGTYDTNPSSHAQQICRMAILDQKAHGINAFGCELRFPACNIYKEGNEIKFDLKPLEYRVDFYKSLGIELDKNSKFIWQIGINPTKILAELTGTDTRILDKYVVEPLSFTDSFLNVYSQIVRAVEEYTKKNNLPEMYLFNIDEPYGVYKNKVALQLLQATKKGGGHSWVTVNDTYYEPLKEYLDVPVFANGYASYKTYEEYKKTGKKFWFYSAAPRGLRAVYARYETGIYLYKVGFEGATWFAYSWSLGNAYNGLESMWNATHPGFWEFVPTISWECTREGIDDVRYMEFLEELLKNNPDSNIASSFKDLLEIVDPDINNFQHIDPVTDVIVGKDSSTWKSRDLDLMRIFLQQSCSKLIKTAGRQAKQKSIALKDIKVNFVKLTEQQKQKTREVEFYNSRYICHAPVVPKNSVKVDGEMEEVWNQAQKIEDFVKLTYATADIPTPAEDKTRVYILKDSENLYLFFDCFTKDMNKVRTTISAEKRDIKEIWREDGIEIFLDPGNRCFTYYQLMINVNGALTDMKVVNGESQKNDIEWDSNAEAKTKKLKDRWTAEIKIPLKNFENQEVWGINFCRNNSQEKGTHTLWSPTVKSSLGNKGFGVPEKFGRLVLNKNVETLRLIKNIKGILAFQPFGVESRIIIDVEKYMSGKKMDISILNEKGQKIIEKQFIISGENIEMPFLIYQTNEDPVYYLQLTCGDLELKIPFRFLTKDINFFAFPVDAYLIYSSSESQISLNGNIEILEHMLKSGSIEMVLTLKRLFGDTEFFSKKIPLLSNRFDVLMPLKDLASGGYIMEISVEINPEVVFKSQYKFLKL